MDPFTSGNENVYLWHDAIVTSGDHLTVRLLYDRRTQSLFIEHIQMGVSMSSEGFCA